MDYKIWLAFAVGMFIGTSLGALVLGALSMAATRIVYFPMTKTDDGLLIQSWAEWSKNKDNKKLNHG